MTPKKPNSCTNLNKALIRLAGNDAAYLAIRSMMATIIVGQFLPHGAVKGGSQLKLRYGYRHCRYTMDFDTVRNCDLDLFLKTLREGLAIGWNDFTADLYIRPQASPKGVSFDYVMQPVDVKLKYKGQPWCNVLLEIGHNELGAADETETVPLPEEVVTAFQSLGFPVPPPIPLMPLKYQIAQKLHGLSATNSTRVRDLIDLQLIFSSEALPLAPIRDICTRLFRYRNTHPWPPQIIQGDAWATLYTTQRGTLNILPTVEEAIVWINDLILKINTAD